MPFPSQCPRESRPGRVDVREGRGSSPETGKPACRRRMAAGAAETLPRLGRKLRGEPHQLSRTDANEARPHSRSRAYTGLGSRIKRLRLGASVDDQTPRRPVTKWTMKTMSAM